MSSPVRSIFHFLSFFADFVSERVSSVTNPLLEVCFTGGKYVLNSRSVNYSYGGLHTVFRKVFHAYLPDSSCKKVLLLGFGAGSVVSILQEELNVSCSVVAVEIDPIVLELGKKYFKTDRFKNLTVHCEDAYGFVLNSGDRFNIIVVDLFIDSEVPPQFENDEFLLKLKSLLEGSGVLYYNRVISTHRLKNRCEQLSKKMETLLGKTEKFNTGENRVLIYKNNTV